MVLVDTSVWIEYLRNTGSRHHLFLRKLVEEDAPIVVTEIVCAEILAGAEDPRDFERLRSLLRHWSVIPIGGLDQYEDAALLKMACRARGKTVRNIQDCLVATVCLREGFSLLHNDRDFDAIAEVTDLKIYPVGS